MKQFTLLIAIVCFLQIQGQDETLFNHTWNLHELQIDEESFISNQLDIISFITDNEDILGIGNAVCDIGYHATPIVFNAQTSFEIEFISLSPIGPLCDMYNDAEAFQALEDHATFYTIPPTSAPKNPFTYEIIEQGGAIALTITNGNGDIAFYQNVPLSIEENTLAVVELVYEKQNQTLSFTGIQEQMLLEIYSINGVKLVKRSILHNDTIDLSVLSSGVYLISVQDTQFNKKTFKLLIS